MTAEKVLWRAAACAAVQGRVRRFKLILQQDLELYPDMISEILMRASAVLKMSLHAFIKAKPKLNKIAK